MKKIIKGKLYDTETAKSCGSMFYGESYRDFNHFSEELFQKKTGEFFIYGEGGPASKYAESVGQNTWSGSEKIIPLSYDAAQEWAEKNLDTEEYQSIFGDVSEGDDRKTITLSLSESAVALLKRKAAQSELTMSAYIEKMITAE